MPTPRQAAAALVLILIGCGGSTRPNPTATGTSSGGVGGNKGSTSTGAVGATSSQGTGPGTTTGGSSSSVVTGTSGTISRGATGSASIGGATSKGSTGGSVAASGCFTDVSAGHHSFGCDGGVTYDVEIPTTCAGGGCGVILDIHGLGCNAAIEDEGTNMRALGDQNGFVVIQPNAPAASWDPSETFGPLVYDFTQTAAAAMAADLHRLYVMGFSEGGAMTWWEICAHSDVFAAAAPTSAGGVDGCTFIGTNVPPGPIPILDTHGELDNVVSYTLFGIPQRDAALAYWGYGSGTVFEQDSLHTATQYFTDAGTSFQFYSHDYEAASAVFGGHCYPGGMGAGTLLGTFACTNPNEFVWGEKAIQFFMAHPRP